MKYLTLRGRIFGRGARCLDKIARLVPARRHLRRLAIEDRWAEVQTEPRSPSNCFAGELRRAEVIAVSEDKHGRDGSDDRAHDRVYALRRDEVGVADERDHGGDHGALASHPPPDQHGDAENQRADADPQRPRAAVDEIERSEAEADGNLPSANIALARSFRGLEWPPLDRTSGSLLQCKRGGRAGTSSGALLGREKPPRPKRREAVSPNRDASSLFQRVFAQPRPISVMPTAGGVLLQRRSDDQICADTKHASSE